MGQLVSSVADIFGLGPASRQAEAITESAKTSAGAQTEAARLAAEQARFRPVGVTTRFGSSQFGFSPEGYLTSAGYTVSPELRAAQDRLLGLGAGYLAQTPEQVAADYMARQQELLAPSRERQMAQLQNQLFQTGRGGLSVGATGARPSGAAGLGATTPELEAYYNALAQQDAALAAQAEQAGRGQIGFGAGLFGMANELENIAQNPLTLGAGLGGQQAAYGARAGSSLLTGGLGAAQTMQAANMLSPSASGMYGLFSSPALNPSFDEVRRLFGGSGGTVGNIGDTSAFDYAYGGGGFY